ncbi:MAG: outer membrane lipoprotein-sorting protein [Deltaproteobacteria bacterium]|nr:outer membrane lipoprotein-sorting protein [Deltaproteobacteria bacterium]
MVLDSKKQFLLLFFIPFSVYAADGKPVIERMIQKLRAHSNISEYEMMITRPAWTRTIGLKVWDDRAKARVFVRLLAPPKDAGTSFLRVGYNLWNYLPKVEKVMKIPPSMMLQPWMGSDFTNDDLVKESSYVDDYDHKIVGHEVREGEKIIEVELTPKPNAPVVWGRVIYRLREKDSLPVEQQFIDERGRLIKVLVFREFKLMDGVIHPLFWEMENRQKEGQKTTIRLLNVDFDPMPPIPESVFTERNLRS